MARNKAPQYHTPIGVAHYPRIDTADTKYNKHGNYKANVRVTVEEAKPLIEKLQKIVEDQIGRKLKAKDNNCWFYELDDNDEETGYVIFKLVAKNREFTDKQTGEKKVWDRQPKVFSGGSGALVKPCPRVGAGTKYKVVFETYVGKDQDGKQYLNLQPVAVIIYDLVEWKPKEYSAEDFGVEVSEDAWVPTETTDAEDHGIDLEGDTADTDSSEPELQEGEDDF